MEDAEGDQLVGVEIGEMLILHFAREVESDILNRHRVLLLLIHWKSQLLHLPRVVRVSPKVKKAGALAVVEKALALELSGIARDGEVDILASGLREVHTYKKARGPVGGVVRVAAVVMFDQRELHLSGFVGLADGPVAVACLRRVVL